MTEHDEAERLRKELSMCAKARAKQRDELRRLHRTVTAMKDNAALLRDELLNERRRADTLARRLHNRQPVDTADDSVIDTTDTF